MKSCLELWMICGTVLPGKFIRKELDRIKDLAQEIDSSIHQILA